jgi:D-glycero-alpha-D-manno-heptose-7-phosphate kinase
MIISKTPLRVSLVGGGTDVPAFYEQSPGAVVSFAISKYIYVAVNEKFDGCFRVSYSVTENVDRVEEIKHSLVRHTLKHQKPKAGLEIVSIADIPGEGTGLGSSSAFEVGLLHAFNWNEHYVSPRLLAETAFQIERECHRDIGKQDHYAAAYGGFNRFRFKPSSVDVEMLYPPDMRWFLLLYTGITRKADDLLRAQSKAFQADKLAIGKEMAALAENFSEENISETLQDGWVLKKRLYKGVTNDQIDDWYIRAIMAGAQGGKICGAGGGGFLLFYAPPDAHEGIVKATGLRKVDFQISTEGSKVIYG